MLIVRKPTLAVAVAPAVALAPALIKKTPRIWGLL
jgi:hypothetical protein